MAAAQGVPRRPPGRDWRMFGRRGDWLIDRGAASVDKL
jgi:hypothetical protein